MKLTNILLGALAITSSNALNFKSLLNSLRDSPATANSPNSGKPPNSGNPPNNASNSGNPSNNAHNSDNPPNNASNQGNSKGDSSNPKVILVKQYLYKAIDQFLDQHPQAVDILIQLYQEIKKPSSNGSIQGQQAH